VRVQSLMLRTFPGPRLTFPTRLSYSRYAFLLQCIFAVLLALLLARESLAFGLDVLLLNLLFLFLAVLFATHFGFWQASILTVSAILCLTYFYAPPIFVRHIATTHNAINLIIFEATALVVSRVATRERTYAAENEIQRHRTQRLHAVSHNVLLLSLQDSPERQIAEFIQEEFELDAVAIVSKLPHSVGAAGLWAKKEDLASEETLRAVATNRHQLPGVAVRPLHSARGPIGSLLVRGDIPQVVLDSLASLAALALERHRACVNEGAADAARKTEQLRTTVLDGLAHAFKTPLTIIRAASSGLLEAGHLDETQHQLTQMIDEQSEKLDDMTNRLLETARVEGEAMCLQLETIDVPSLIHEVVREFRAESMDPTNAFTAINICADGIFTRITGDFDMIASTLSELLKNATKYSAVGSPITIALSENSDELILSVQNYGPVIRMEDRDRIFERFYRGLDHRHAAPGTGLGLSVAQRVTEAHGGHIWVTSSEESGTTFHLSLPTGTEALTGAKG
jgi:two-component system, OmpR family, sensor histidine kinase KdpD